MKYLPKGKRILLFLLMLIFILSFKIEARDIKKNRTFPNNFTIATGDTWRVTGSGTVTITVKNDLIIKDGGKLTYQRGCGLDKLIIKVDGNVTINGKIDLKGDKGDNGGRDGKRGTDGRSGTDGVNLKINVSQKSMVLNGMINTKGGAGGDGGEAKDANYNRTGGSGGDGDNGGNGGNVELVIEEGNLTVGGRITTAGGNGGDGGDGGEASYNHSGGDGGDGEDGGNGGSINLYTKNSSLYINNGNIISDAGLGGDDGSGGDDTVTQDGGSSGSDGRGGTAGQIIIIGKYFENTSGSVISSNGWENDELAYPGTSKTPQIYMGYGKITDEVIRDRQEFHRRPTDWHEMIKNLEYRKDYYYYTIYEKKNFMPNKKITKDENPPNSNQLTIDIENPKNAVDSFESKAYTNNNDPTISWGREDGKAIKDGASTRDKVPVSGVDGSWVELRKEKDNGNYIKIAEAYTQNNNITLEFFRRQIERKISQLEKELREYKDSFWDEIIYEDEIDELEDKLKVLRERRSHLYNLEDGKYKVTVKLQDNAKQRDSIGKSKEFIVDTQNPEIPDLDGISLGSTAEKAVINITWFKPFDPGRAYINYYDVELYKDDYTEDKEPLLQREYTKDSTGVNLKLSEYNQKVTYRIRAWDQAGNSSTEEIDGSFINWLEGTLITPPAKAKIKGVSTGGVHEDYVDENHEPYYVKLKFLDLGDKVHQYKIVRKKKDGNEYIKEAETIWFDLEEKNKENYSIKKAGETEDGQAIYVFKDTELGSIPLEKHGKYKYVVKTVNSYTNQYDKCVTSINTNPIQIENNIPIARGIISPTKDLYNKEEINNLEYINFAVSQFEDKDDDRLRYKFVVANEEEEPLFTRSFRRRDTDYNLDTDDLADGEYYWWVEVKDDYEIDGQEGITPSDVVKNTPIKFEVDTWLPEIPILKISEDNVGSGANVYNREIYTANSQISLKNIKVKNLDNDIEQLKVQVINDSTGDKINSKVVDVSLSNLTDSDNKLVNINGENKLGINLGTSEGRKIIRLQAVDKAENIGKKKDIYCTYDTKAPNNPADFSYDGKEKALEVNWTKPGDNGASGISHYQVEYKRVSQTEPTYTAKKAVNEETADGQSCTITGLGDNEPVWVRIKAVDKAGNANSSWVTKEEGYYGYSLPETGAITGHSLDYKQNQDGSFTHFADFDLKQVKAAAFKVRWQEVNSGVIKESDWITDTNKLSFRGEVAAHKEYTCQIITKNPHGEEVSSAEYSFAMPNHAPTKPEIDAQAYRYITQLPLELRTEKSTDSDLDPLKYYFTLQEETGTKLIDRAQTNIEDRLSYLVAEDKLSEGETYQWWVEVEDGYGGSTKSAVITTTIDLSKPEVSNLTTSNQDYLPNLTIEADINDPISGIKEIKYYWNDNQDNPTVLSPGGVSQKLFELEAIQGDNQLHFKVIDKAGNQTNWLVRNYKVDKTPPEINNLSLEGRMIDGKYYTTNRNSLYGSWQISEDETAIEYYRYAAVKDSKLSNLASLEDSRFTKVDVNAYQESFDQVVEGPFSEGDNYYLVIEGVNKAGRSSGLIVSNKGVTIDAAAPVINNLVLENIESYGNKAYLGDLNNLSVTKDIIDKGVGVSTINYALVSDIKEESINWKSSLDDLKSSAQVTDGSTYYLAVKAVDKLGQTSIDYSRPLVIDQTAPQITELTAGSKLQIDSQSDPYQIKPGYRIPVSLAVEDETGLVELKYAIGSSKGSNDISSNLYPDQDGWLSLENKLIQQFAVREELSEGTYYITVKAVNKAGLVTEYSTNPIEVDSNNAPLPQVEDDGEYTADNQSLHFEWRFKDSEGEVVGYKYQIVDHNEEVITDWQEGEIKEARNSQSKVVSNLNLTTGKEYFIKVKALYQDNTESGIGWSNGVVVDTTKPNSLMIDDGSYTSSTKLHLNWEAKDSESPIGNYQIKIGTTPGGSEVTGEWIELDKSGEGVITGLDLKPNQVYFTTLRAINRAGLIRETTSDGFRADDTPPPLPLVLDGGSYTNEKRLEFNWRWSKVDQESGIKEYKYALLTKREVSADTEWQSAGKEEKVIITDGLSDNQKYYLAVKTVNKAGLTTINYSDGILIDTTAPDPPEVNDLTDYQLADKSSLAAKFIASDKESGIDHYEYSVGTFKDRETLVSNQEFSGTDITVQDLGLTPGKIYFFTVKAINNAGLVSMQAMSNGVKIIDDYPEISNVKDYGDYTTFADKLVLSWDCNSENAPIDYYEVAVSTSPTADNLDWQQTNKKQVVIKPEDIGVDQFAKGKKYYAYIRGVDQAGIKTPTDKLGKSDGILVDNTAPTTPKIIHADNYTTNQFNLHWESVEPDSKIVRYRYAVGTTRGGSEITDGWREVATNKQLYEKLLSLNLEHKKRYYVTVQSRNIVGLWSKISYGSGVVADLTPPEKPVLDYRGNQEYAGNYITNLNKITDLNWKSKDLETGITGYRYQIVKDKTKLSDWSKVETYGTTTNQLTIDLTNLTLTEAEKYYIAFQARNRLGVWSSTGFSRELTVDTIAPTITLEQGAGEIVTNDGTAKAPWSVSEEAVVYKQLLKPDGTKDPESGYYQQDSQGGVDYTYNFAEDKSLEGTYYLKLYGIDPAGNQGEVATQQIRINAKPRVNVGSDLSEFKGRKVNFDAETFDKDGEIVEYRWEFGDNSGVKTTETSVHSFSELGMYKVTLTCIDNDNGKGSDSLWIKITNTTEGRLRLDETWRDQMKITGTVIVPPFINLTINPDTEVIFPAGTKLVIYGNLEAEGTSSNQVIFTNAGLIDQWKGIKADQAISPVNLQNAVIENAERGLTLNKSEGQISSVVFRKNKVGLHLLESSPTVKYSEFIDNSLYGIKEDGAVKPELTLNVFQDNWVGAYYDSKLTLLTPEEIIRLNEE